MWLSGASRGVSLNNLPTLCCTCTLKENTKVWSLGHQDQSWQLLGVCSRWWFSLFHNDAMKDDSACTRDDKPQNYTTRRSISFRPKLDFSTNIQYFSKTLSLILNQNIQTEGERRHWASRANVTTDSKLTSAELTLLSQHRSEYKQLPARSNRTGKNVSGARWQPGAADLRLCRTYYCGRSPL